MRCGYSILEVLGASTTINFGRVFGDGTGTLISQEGQTLLFETDLPTTSLCVLECSIEVTIQLQCFPPYLAIDHNAHLSVRGKLDAQTVYVEKGGTLEFFKTTQCIQLTEANKFFFTDLTLKKGASFIVADGLTISGGIFEVKRDVTVRMEYFNISTSQLIVEQGAVLDVSGQGPIDPGHASAGNAQTRGGGGHGGPGVWERQ
ncbi:hypothetical protein BSL78_29830 [Apostichopus japonicus]|uniref:Uncharacterized protein n=1 Tax=Stichopus japonicus TaxID=307972 RepID=A0A2G8JC89_STIJA|nr:hypothetical protein BSL78_29830 [Apostichopus japonicus]